MAETLSEFPAPSRRGGRKEVYPWDDWFDGQIWKLVQPTDFTTKPDSMRTAATSAAKRRDVKIKTSVNKEENSLVIQKLNGKPKRAKRS